MVDLSANVNCPVACLIIGFVGLSVCLKSEIMAEELLATQTVQDNIQGTTTEKETASF